jgi:hypothetical protein
MNKSSSDVTRRTAIRVAIAGAAAVAAGEARAPRQAASDMERVQGIGGFFFRAKDPTKLGGWYEANLGVTTSLTITIPCRGGPAQGQRSSHHSRRTRRTLATGGSNG